MNIIFKDRAGKMLSLEQLTNDPALIYNNNKLTLIKDYDKARYENISTWYSAMFPLRGQPRRSTPGIYKTHIFDWFMDAYFKIFKNNFSDFYQGIYLKIKSKQFANQDLKFFYLARNYHLFNRSDKALLYYNELLRKFPESAYKKDTLFFMGILYFYILKDYDKAIYFFKLTVDIYPDKRVRAANYYLGLAYGYSEDKKESLSAYRNTDITKVKREVLRELIKYKTEELSIGGLKFTGGYLKNEDFNYRRSGIGGFARGGIFRQEKMGGYGFR
jgi:tetratricopeptide (TPR) repeat protein